MAAARERKLVTICYELDLAAGAVEARVGAVASSQGANGHKHENDGDSSHTPIVH